MHRFKVILNIEVNDEYVHRTGVLGGGDYAHLPTIEALARQAVMGMGIWGRYGRVTIDSIRDCAEPPPRPWSKYDAIVPED